jgi:very-short-patch-repair endonuclease
MARRAWRELRFTNSDIHDESPDVLEAIWEKLQRLKEVPSPAGGGG